MDTFLYAVIPYLAVLVAVVGGVARYRSDRFSYSSQSSQLLENRVLFWGSAAWHYGILVVLGGHVIALMFWDAWATVLSSPTRLYALEIVGLAFSILAFVGLAVLMTRRIVNSRIRSVTSVMDWIVLTILLGQVAVGIYIATSNRWGSNWYMDTVVPWLISLFKLQPETQYLSVLPNVVQAHAVMGFFLIALFPFSRLVHVVTVPVTYLWRPYQVVIWNRRGG
jgi:nitrate reductase gamma subunit